MTQRRIVTNRTIEATVQTYSYYFTREYLAPLILFILCTALTILLIPIQLMLKRSSRLKRHFKAHFLIKFIFRIMLNKRSDKAGKVVYTILDYEVSERYKVLMLAVAISLTGVGGVVFWDYFIFEDSYICSTDPNLACFPAFPNLTSPRLDCSNTSYLKVNNITSIICYRYSFVLGSATGGALGVVTNYALVFIIKTLLLLKVSNGSEWTKQVSCSAHCSYTDHYSSDNIQHSYSSIHLSSTEFIYH